MRRVVVVAPLLLWSVALGAPHRGASSGSDLEIIRANVHNLAPLGGVSLESPLVAPRGAVAAVPFHLSGAGWTQPHELEFQLLQPGSNQVLSSRVVTWAPQERGAVYVPAPPWARYVSVVVTDRTARTRSTPTNADLNAPYNPVPTALLIGPESEFVADAAGSPGGTGRVVAHTCTKEWAPTELWTLLPYSRVGVIGERFSSLSTELQQVLEAYVFSGGHLALTEHEWPDWVSDGKVGEDAATHGLGWVFFIESLDEMGDERLQRPNPVMPQEFNPASSRYAARYGASGGEWAASGGSSPLLEQAVPPAGPLAGMMLLFAAVLFAVSVMTARKKGAWAILLTLPLLSCVATGSVLAFAFFGNGIKTHVHLQTLEWLDSEQHRVVRQQVVAAFPNLAVGTMTFPRDVVLWSPSADQLGGVIRLEQQNGLRVLGGLLPGREYNEFGVTSVEPSRARLQVEKRSGRVVARQALGARAERLVVNLRGVKYESTGPCDDGQEVELVAASSVSVKDVLNPKRFSPALSTLAAAVKPGEFFARLAEPASGTLYGVSAEFEGSVRVVRGRHEE